MDAEHLDDDELVTLCDALRWAPDAGLAHLAACPRCRGTLREIAGLHDAFDVAAVPPSLVASAQGAVAAAARGEEARVAPPAPLHRPPRLSLAQVATGLLAGGTAFAALVAFGMVNPLTAGALAPAAGLALGVALVTGHPGAARRVRRLAAL